MTYTKEQAAEIQEIAKTLQERPELAELIRLFAELKNPEHKRLVLEKVQQMKKQRQE